MKILDINFNRAVVIDGDSRADQLYHMNDDEVWRRNSIYYEAGTHEDRYAKIVDVGGDKALLFKLMNAAIIDPVWGSPKGRVQLHADVDASETHEYKRMAISPAMDSYRTYSGTGWKHIILGEIWCGRPWMGDPYASIISSVLINRDEKLYLAYGMQSQNTEEHDGVWAGKGWNAPIRDIPIPVGEWVELYSIYRMGDKDTGVFVAYIRRPGENWRSLCGIRNWTYNPDSPEPVRAMIQNPCKIYASGQVIDHVRNAGGSLSILWDDVWIRKVK